MKRKMNTIASLSMLGVLLGCAPLTPGASVSGAAASLYRAKADVMPVKVQAVAAVIPAMPSHESLYTVGRAAHGEGQFSLAAQRYEKVLEMKPDHVGALNALAVIHAQLGRADEAFKLFFRARQLAPGAAHIHNNAGYALLRSGRLDEAELALKLALKLDPLSVQTQQNLELLAKARAESGPAVQMAQVLEAVQPGAVANAGPTLVRVAPQVYALKLPATEVAAENKLVQAAASRTDSNPSPSLTSGGESELRGVRLEVSNGAGVPRLARRTADRLAVMGVVTDRLTNARSYGRAKTEIQFVQGQELTAQLLQSRLPLAARAVPASRLGAGMQLRLVLGHDAAGSAVAAWLEAEERQQAIAMHDRGWRWSDLAPEKLSS